LYQSEEDGAMYVCFDAGYQLDGNFRRGYFPVSCNPLNARQAITSMQG
jgi:hypothetical protein